MNAALMLATAMGRRIPADLQTLLKGDGGVRPFSLNEEAEEFIWQKLAQIPWKAKGHQQYATLRKLIISDTDFPVKLLANPSDHNLYILTTLAETHESRMKLAQLGLASAIECVARRTASDGNQTSPNHWVWTLFNHIEYIENVPASVVTALLGRLDWNRNAIPCLYRIALRGPSTKSLMEPVCEPLLQRLPAGIQLDIYRLQEHSCIMLAAALYHATSDERLLNLFHLEDDLAGVRARAKYFHYRCSLERNSRQHLAISGYMRPGESILTYMGLCSSNDATVCYLAAVHLASILTMASPHLFQFEPFDTVGARLMTQQAVKAQAELNSKLTGIQYEVQPNVHPFTLLTQCILNLTEHENKHVRDMGKNCLGRLPNRILIKVPWSPSMHRFFDADEVRLTLMLCGRKSIPSDVCIGHILPFVCQLPLNSSTSQSRSWLAGDW